MEKAVVDRITDGKTAVILVGEDERQYLYPAHRLPQGVREGIWLRIRVEDGEIVALDVDQDETDAVRRRVDEKMGQLRARGRLAG